MHSHKVTQDFELTKISTYSYTKLRELNFQLNSLKQKSTTLFHLLSETSKFRKELKLIFLKVHDLLSLNLGLELNCLVSGVNTEVVIYQLELGTIVIACSFKRYCVLAYKLLVMLFNIGSNFCVTYIMYET